MSVTVCVVQPVYSAVASPVADGVASFGCWCLALQASVGCGASIQDWEFVFSGFPLGCYDWKWEPWTKEWPQPAACGISADPTWRHFEVTKLWSHSLSQALLSAISFCTSSEYLDQQPDLPLLSHAVLLVLRTLGRGQESRPERG